MYHRVTVNLTDADSKEGAVMLYRCLFMCRVITAVFDCCVVMCLLDKCVSTRFPITIVSDIVAFVLKREVK